MASLKSTLKDAVRKLAYSTSVDQLKKRGVKNVSVVGLDRIVQLIEEAVHRSLRHRLLVADREAVVDATKEEFLRLLRSNEELKERQERAEEEAEVLRLELSRLRQELEQRMSEVQADHRHEYLRQDARIQDLVATALAEFDAGGGGTAGLESRVMELVMDVVEKERRTAEAATEAARDHDVSLLQRRIAKLTQSLDATEKKLTEVAAMKQLDPGIASIYRDVQGVSTAEDHYEKKKELMAGIFTANLKLQKKG